MDFWIFRIVEGNASSDLAKFEDGEKARTIFEAVAKNSTPRISQLLLVSPSGEEMGRISAAHSSGRAKEARC